MIKVMFATPSFGGVVEVGYLSSLMRTMDILKAAGIPSAVTFVSNDSLIGRARNSLVKQFLDTDFTHLFFIDADLEWDPQAPLKMVQADKSMVCGLYPLKQDPEAYPVTFETDVNGNAEMRDGLVPVTQAPGGFMCLTRDMLERMIRKFPDLKYNGFAHDSGSAVYNLFHCELRHGEYYGEDMVFCDRWREISGNIYAMPDISFKHVGPKKWSGNYLTFHMGKQ